MRVAGPEALGRALVARRRAARTAIRTPTRTTSSQLPELDADLRAHAGRPAREELLPVYLAAFAPGHPDRHGARRGRHAPRRGVIRQAGGLLAGSGLAIEDGRVVGAILIGTITEAPPPFGGPWIMEVFSTARGAGRALLERALHRSTGSLGLAVTEGNPADRLYESLGFRRIFTAYSVDL